MRSASLSCLLIAAAVSACSSGSSSPGSPTPASTSMTPSPVSQTVTASDGGTVTEPGAILRIPPGALDGDTTITVNVVDKTDLPMADSIGAPVFDFGPDGAMFSVPIELSVDFDGPVPPGKQAVLAFLDGGAWTPLGDSSVSGSTVTAHTTHFSLYTVVFIDSSQADGICAAPFDACGGDLTGTWSVSVACANIAPEDAPIQSCPGSAVSVTVVPTGSVTFDPANGALFLNAFDLLADISGTFPASCAPNGDCSQETTNWGGSLSFTKSGSSCRVSGQSGTNDGKPQTETETLLVSGNQFQTQKPGDPMPSDPWSFCVQEDVLTVEGPIGQGGSSTVRFTATRQ